MIGSLRWVLLEPLWKRRGELVSLEQRRFDARAMRVGLLLLAVVVLNGVDLAYTLFAQQVPAFREVNPIAESFFNLGLEPSLVCYKILMVMSGTLMLWKLRRSRWALPACWVLLVAFVGLAVVWYVWVQDVNKWLEVAGTDWGRIRR